MSSSSGRLASRLNHLEAKVQEELDFAPPGDIDTMMWVSGARWILDDIWKIIDSES